MVLPRLSSADVLQNPLGAMSCPLQPHRLGKDSSLLRQHGPPKLGFPLLSETDSALGVMHLWVTQFYSHL